MADSPEEIQKHVKTYMMVGAALFVGTVLTVVVAKITPSITIGLSIACVKASLVALIFMHLNHERPIIYKILLFTVFFFIGLMLLTIMALYDPVIDRHFYD